VLGSPGFARWDAPEAGWASAPAPRLSILLDGLVWVLSRLLPPKPKLPHFLVVVNLGMNL
jgi:hypothetical protein